jgi:maleate isomerase
MFPGRTNDSRATALRVGLIAPSSNTVMEPEFHHALAGVALVSTTRVHLEDVSREAELRMLQGLPHAVELLLTGAPDVVVFGCTSAGALAPPSHGEDIADLIWRMSGATAVTVVGAVLARLQALAPRRLALFTPYVDDLTEAVADALANAGFPPVKAAGMGIRDNLEIGSVPSSAVAEFVESGLAGCSADCVFLSCTNWQSRAAIEPLEARLHVPVLTSNQCAISAVLGLAEAAVEVGLLGASGAAVS